MSTLQWFCTDEEIFVKQLCLTIFSCSHSDRSRPLSPMTTLRLRFRRRIRSRSVISLGISLSIGFLFFERCETIIWDEFGGFRTKLEKGIMRHRLSILVFLPIFFRCCSLFDIFILAGVILWGKVRLGARLSASTTQVILRK